MKPMEITSEPNGWLNETSYFQELEIEVDHGIDELLVTMNHEPGESTSEMYNDFDMELIGPSSSDGKTAKLASNCDNTWKLLSICRVPSPAPGTWKARVIRKHGEGHFQLVATGITR